LANAHSQGIPQHVGMRLEVIRNSAPARPYERNPADSGARRSETKKKGEAGLSR
jgi:hypothetical protein